MEYCILSLGTITRAIAARRILTASRIRCRMIKTTGDTAKGGCAYGLKIYEEDLLRAIRLLEESQIPFEWKREGNG